MNQPNELPSGTNWPLWQKIAFRFFCIYFLFHIAPWTWLNGQLPGMNYITQYYHSAIYWIVEQFNSHLFHFPATSIVNNGSGDTSIDYETAFSFLVLAGMGTLLWSLLDRKRRSYTQANYWLRTFMRYYLVLMCLNYGVIKWYSLQMPFPLQSQLATPLGDFLPMRFSWLFIGYSTPYEMFSGAMEITAGLLLLNRKTITLGLLVALAVMTNVMVLNLCYDIPVKLFSMHLVLYCIYLLANDIKRILNFFVFNKTVNPNTIHHISFTKKWMRITRIVLKLAFIGFFVVMPFFRVKSWYKSSNPLSTTPIKAGIYDVVVFAVNKDTIPPLISDTLRWRDMIFETNGIGSVGSTDTAFRQRYRRGYFSVSIDDSTKQAILLKKSSSAADNIARLHFAVPDSNTVRLWGSKGNDSLYIILKRSKRHFQLAERQFHWISEANR